MYATMMFKASIMDWLRQNGFNDVKTVMLAEEFGYEIDSHIINFGVCSLDIIGDWFEDFLLDNGCQYHDIPKPLLAFLHELGHNQTVYDFSTEEVAWCRLLKNTIDPEHGREHCNRYWSIPDEMIANEWVVSFINNHITAIINLFEIYNKWWSLMEKQDNIDFICGTAGIRI